MIVFVTALECATLLYINAVSAFRVDFFAQHTTIIFVTALASAQMQGQNFRADFFFASVTSALSKALSDSNSFSCEQIASGPGAVTPSVTCVTSRCGESAAPECGEGSVSRLPACTRGANVSESDAQNYFQIFQGVYHRPKAISSEDRRFVNLTFQIQHGSQTCWASSAILRWDDFGRRRQVRVGRRVDDRHQFSDAVLRLRSTADCSMARHKQTSWCSGSGMLPAMIKYYSAID